MQATVRPRATLPATRSRPALRVACSAETPPTHHLFTERVTLKGWKAPTSLQTLHPVAQEAWRSIHSIYSAAYETPLVPAPWLADLSQGLVVHLKGEDRQAGGTAKTRGAVHKLLSLSDAQLSRGITAASTGNHALALLVATDAVKRLRGIDVPTRIFLPRSVPPQQLEKLRHRGAAVEVVGMEAAEAEEEAQAAAAESGATFVSAWNDVAMAGGQGSIGVELLMQLARGQLDMVFVPVGGGGLAAGVAAVLKSVDPSIHIVGCQPATANALQQAVLSGAGQTRQPASAAAGGTSAVQHGQPRQQGQQGQQGEASLFDGMPTGGVDAGAATVEPCRRFVDEWVSVSEREIAHAVIETTSRSGMQVEGATGVAVAAFHKLAPELRGKHVVIVATGGNMTAEGMERVYRAAGMLRPSAAGV